MKKCKVIQQAELKQFEAAIDKKLNEGYKIESTNMFTSKDPFRPYIYYALLTKEC